MGHHLGQGPHGLSFLVLPPLESGRGIQALRFAEQVAQKRSYRIAIAGSTVRIPHAPHWEAAILWILFLDLVALVVLWWVTRRHAYRLGTLLKRAVARRSNNPSTRARAEDVSVPLARGAVDVVRRLSPIVEHLSTVTQCANDLLKVCLKAVPAQAAVVLLPDGGQWRVAGGVSLRSREPSLRLDPDHWLLEQVAKARGGVIIEDTDANRASLSGVPLASWQSLLAVPMPAAGGVLMLARDRKDEPFSTKELRTLAKLADSGCDACQDAMDVRDLARRLSQFQDLPGGGYVLDLTQQRQRVHR